MLAKDEHLILSVFRMYFILKTLKGYTLSLLTLVAFTGLISSLASLTLLFIESDKFALDELLLAPSQLPMGQGLQQLRADIIHVSSNEIKCECRSW